MPIEITPLTEADIPGAIDTIQQAFTEDPYNRWVFNDRSTFSLARNRVSLRIRCLWGIHNALFFVAKDTSSDDKDKVLGTAMWMPPRPASEQESWDEWIQAWWLWLRQVGMNAWWGRGGLNVKRYYIWKTTQALVQKSIWTDPQGYYFCNIVTVLPSEQGKGIGKLLFKAVTDRADAEGRRCYLESSRDEPNVKIYEKLGFKMIKEMECDDDGEACKVGVDDEGSLNGLGGG
ncbi:gnat family protein [Lasallia pustulata]|uniref:Gnat family protein n=1 Tax=Lasallia pustulata TaxID=136370 RepID=A0A1W5D045_9LECA|nr:gnat family protein [Lasallia pustulata]